MARVAGWTDGAERGDLLFFDVYSGVTAAVDYVASGTYSYKFTGTHTATKNLATNLSTFYFRVRFRAASTASMTFINFRKGSTVLLSVKWNNSTGRIELQSESSTLLASTSVSINHSTWALLEFYVNIADAGNFNCKIDGASAATYSGDTKPGADTEIDNINFNCAAGGFWIDDIALDDAAYPGAGRVGAARKPDGNGYSSQFTGSDADSVDNYLLVDDIPSTSADYVESDTIGHIDSYTAEAVPAVSGSIVAAWVDATIYDTAATARTAKLILRSGGNLYRSDAITLGGSAQREVGPFYLTDPATSIAWTDTTLSAVEIAAEVIS